MTFSSSPPRMKFAGVATIDSFRESIVGFQKVTNAHGYREERSNRGYQNPHFHRRLSCPKGHHVTIKSWSESVGQ
jgi:hypothetical protein